MVTAGVLMLVFIGCGKKGPPLPPIVKGKKIAAPYKLKYTHTDKEIILRWKHEIDPETAAIEPDGFDIYRAKKAFDACEGCPFEFIKIGYVPMPSNQFISNIEKGFKYYYRVQAVNDDNMKSSYSKTVQYEYK